MRTFRRYEDPAVERVVTEDPDYLAPAYGGWGISTFVAGAVGVAATVIGLIALVRAGIDKSWFQPVVQVLDANHTALLGALELGGGVLLILAAASRARGLSALVGLAMVVGGVFAAVQTSDVHRQLAIEDWWAWVIVGAGAVVTLASMAPTTTRRRVL
jgi:hypothetical protein